MAREYARVKIKIWADGDFRELSDGAQALYFRLITSPTMNLAGVADWRPKRLAALTAGMTAGMVEENAREMEERGYVVVDEDTEEILVRSFVRHDGLIKTPNIAAAMVKDYAGVASRDLRAVIVHELRRLHDENPEMSGWSVAGSLLSHPSSNPSGNPSPNPSGTASGTASPIPSGNASHIPQPATRNQQPASRRTELRSVGASDDALLPPPDDPTPSKPTKTRGSRIPTGFAITDDMRAWAKTNGLDYLNLDAITEKFVDYWAAKSGASATKVDWIATWRNWLRTESERHPPPPMRRDPLAHVRRIE